MLKSTTRIPKQKAGTRAAAIQPRKKPVQSRSTETVRAILEASARILESSGIGRFNTNAVAERAGVSIGSLYQFFPGKDAILAALIEQQESAMLARFQSTFEQIQSLSLDACLRALTRTLVEVHRERWKLHRLLEAEEGRLLGGAERGPLYPVLHASLADLLRKHHRSLSIRNILESAHDVIWIARAVIHGALSRGESCWPSIERRLLRAVHGYLCA